MELPGWLRRGLAGAVGVAGLAYPACAAICPKARGGCPYPGRCFLYTDVDANSLCDYTSPSAGSPTVAAQATPAGTPVPDPTTLPVTTSPLPPNMGGYPAATVTSNTSLPLSPDPGSLIPDPWLLGILAALLIGVVLFFLFRSGVLGTRTLKAGPALGAASLFALGTGEMITYLLVGEETMASAFAIVYLLVGSLLAASLWKTGGMSRKIAIAAVAMSALFGFVLLAPLMPIEFSGLVGIARGSQTLAPGVIGILAGIGIVLFVGRTFCGHLCPVGSVQELAWNVPGKKIDITRTRALEAMRLGIFAAAIIAALFSVNLIDYTGIYDFFSLMLSVGSVVFLLLLGVSVVVYRPVCRGICPFGLLFSLPAHFSLYRLRRTGACINCRKCEKACPAHVAGRESSKRECYLCARCTAACPVPGALVYGK